MPHGLPPPLEFAFTDEVSDLQWLLLEIERLEGCPETKRRVVLLLRGNAGKRLYLAYRVLVRPAHVAHAAQLLSAGKSRAEVRAALVQSLGCSKQHAYNLINEAFREMGRQRGDALARAQIDMFRETTA